MSTLKVNKIQDTTGDDALTFDSSGNTTVNQTLTTTSANITTGGTHNLTISDGDLVIGTSGHGISFAATGDPTNGSDTSELLSDYEEGTWTPSDASGQSISFSNVEGHYTRIGRLVVAEGSATWPSTGGQWAWVLGGLPYAGSNNAKRAGGGFPRYNESAYSSNLMVNQNVATFQSARDDGSAAYVKNTEMSTKRLDFVLVYATGF